MNPKKTTALSRTQNVCILAADCCPLLPAGMCVGGGSWGLQGRQASVLLLLVLGDR